jgi:ABC-type glutathione transport system ATPase component
LVKNEVQLTDLHVAYGRQTVLNNLSLAIRPGEVVGITGASGAGKSTLARALAGLSLPGATVSGRIQVAPNTAFVPQEPSLSLSPFLTVGSQVLDSLRGMPVANPIECIMEMFSQIGLRDLARIYNSYPHQLSGGQRQRIAWAQAWITKPECVVADEPTSALDSILQWEIVKQVKKLVEQKNTTLVWVSHDLDLLAELGCRLLVVDQGKVFEGKR